VQQSRSKFPHSRPALDDLCLLVHSGSVCILYNVDDNTRHFIPSPTLTGHYNGQCSWTTPPPQNKELLVRAPTKCTELANMKVPIKGASFLEQGRPAPWLRASYETQRCKTCLSEWVCVSRRSIPHECIKILPRRLGRDNRTPVIAVTPFYGPVAFHLQAFCACFGRLFLAIIFADGEDDEDDLHKDNWDIFC
jgi:hypothetical protein